MNSVRLPLIITSALCIPRLKESGSKLGRYLGFGIGCSVGMVLVEYVGSTIGFSLGMFLGLANGKLVGV